MGKYEKYKDSGFDWIGEIPEHWEFEKLGWQGEFSASGIDKKTVKGEPLVNMINYTDVYGNEKLTLTDDEKYMVVSCPETKKRIHQVNIGDLIFTPSSETVDEIGLSALVIDDLPDTVYSYHVIRLQFAKGFDVNYRKYLCNNNFVLNQFSREAKGTTRQIIGRDVFKNIGVVIPPKPEQTTIADYLDHKTAEIDELISQKEQLLKLY
ncbi:MAG: restriction endonuclease subunit S, partial [Bacteroidales bacterium]|nr:restriction endonuclease subunit S [Bacteroidales bacterium]